MTPVLLPHLKEAPHVHSNLDPITIQAEPHADDIKNARSAANLTRDELLKLRDTTPCSLNCSLRKRLINLKIWGQHHGCRDNPGRGSTTAAPRVIPVLTTAISTRTGSVFKKYRRPNPLLILRADISDSLGNEGLVQLDNTPSSIQMVISPRYPVVIPRREDTSKVHLVKIQKTKEPHTKDLKFSLLNVRSVGDKKAGQIQDFVINEAVLPSQKHG